MSRVALVTDRGSIAPGGDGPLLLAAFSALGIDTEVVPWGSDASWASFDAALIRNTWDYIFDRDAFLEWAGRVSTQTRLANSVDVLRWNTDKRYLRDLQAAGIPIVPTIWVDGGDAVPAVDWDEFVVKPSVSAGGLLSARYRRGVDLSSHIRSIHETGAVAMVQPYLLSIDDAGETGTYVFGGCVSHAISKGAILSPGRPPIADISDGAATQPVDATPVTPELEAFALAVLRAAPPVLYGRVDTAAGPDGKTVLLELEVTEPYLFLEYAPQGAANFARAVAAWLGG